MVKFLGGQLEFEKGSVHLVHEKNRLYTFGNSLPEDGLGLDTYTRDAINDDEGSVSDSESSSYLIRMITDLTFTQLSTRSLKKLFAFEYNC